VGQLFSYVVGILIASLVVFGLHFGMKIGSPAYARQVLANQAAEKSLDELEQAVKEVQGDQLIAAVTAIGQGDDQLQRRVELLGKASASSNKSVQSICMLSIRRMGEASKPAIRNMFESTNSQTVRESCGVVRALGEDGDEFAPQILELLKSDDRRDRHAALYGIQDMSPEAILPGLTEVIKELDDRNFNTQCQACFVLKRLGRSAAPATERLVQLLQEGNPSSRSRASEALGAIGPVEGFDIPELIGKQLESYAYLEKARGLTAVGLLGADGKTPENMARVQRLLDNPNLNCVPEAALAMYQLTGEKDMSLRKLKDLLQNRNSRLSALECLGAMGADASEAVSSVMQHLDDKEPAVCETAILTLKNIGPTADEALPRLQKMLNHEDFLIAVAVQEAIDAISPKTDDQ